MDGEMRMTDLRAMMTDGDKQAELARTVEASNLNPTLFKTTPLLLEAAPRAIVISSEALKANQELSKRNHWPAIEIYSLPRHDPKNLDRASTSGFGEVNRYSNVVRHVEILGPSEIAHRPDMPLDYAGRRVLVLVTSAPLRVFLDTEDQRTLNGVDKNGNLTDEPIPGC